MKKKILAFVAGLTLVSSVGFAAPLNSLNTGETAVGYSYYNMSHSTDNNSYYLENAVSDKFTLGVERNNNSGTLGAKWNTTDIYAQYKLDPNVRLIVGNRDYDYADSRMYFGVGVNTNLAPKLEGYASVITNSYTTEWQAGVNYAMTDRVSLNVAYKNNKDNGYATYDGIGIGLNCKF
ncbi:MAG: hypothetical protein P4N59_18770 [Negativicutes bacterium]|nr:hypothetical protein [Negativicutes bacterium]